MRVQFGRHLRIDLRRTIGMFVRMDLQTTPEVSPGTALPQPAISYSTAPNENRSAAASNSWARSALETYKPPCPSIGPGRSGAAPRPRLATLSTVAHYRSFGPDTFARPKSSTLACPRLVTNIFAGLMSRWMMPWQWAASSASAISMASDKSWSDPSGGRR